MDHIPQTEPFWLLLCLISVDRIFHALADGHTLTDVQGLLDHEDVRTTTLYVEANEQQRFRTMEELSRAGVLRDAAQQPPEALFDGWDKWC